MNGENTEKIILEVPTETSLAVTADTAVKEDSSDTEDLIIERKPIVVEDVIQEERKTGSFYTAFRRVLCVALSAVGIISYGYLAYLGIVFMKNGGLRDIAAKRVFGGAVTVVTPMTDGVEPDEDSVPDITESVSDEYLQISTDDIGITDAYAVFNETKYNIDEESVPVISLPQMENGGTVLVIHTHGTEGYAPDGEVSSDEDFRTSDPEQSVVAVGAAFADKLSSFGINTVHCTTMFDEESYIDAYSRSGAAVSEYMEKYPDISYVIDIHRDAVIRENGNIVRSDGGSGAQLMIVCGTDEMGADFPDWRENFAFGRMYQKALYDHDPKIVRHMNLRGASFNQQLCDKYLLLEIGTCGNTLTEAIDSAKTAASVFADLLG